MKDKIPALKPREVIRILESAGYYVKRQTGSHVIMVNEELRKACLYLIIIVALKRVLYMAL